MANIVHFGKSYFPDTGGIESVTISLARGAASHGHSVSVVCFGGNSWSSEELIDNVFIIRTPKSLIVSSQPIGYEYFTACIRTAKNADIVHLHVPNMLGALCSLFIAKKTRLLVHWHADVLNKGILRKMLRPLESAFLNRADCIVATSLSYEEASKTLANFRNKITIVPIGVPDAKHCGADSRLPTALEKKIKGKKIILAVGRLVPYKGFSVLIDAANYLATDALVVIVGDGPLKQNLNHAIETTRANNHVVLAGRLSDEVLHTLYERATLFCLPSINRAEAFGVVLLEAMSYGLPVVATDIQGSGVPWVNKHGISGFNVPVEDPVALADACNRILVSPELRDTLSEGARKRFATEFTEEVSIKRMMDVYDQMLRV
jgi:glycosyltransferase involved in cell wall biosynthesis